MREKTFTTFQVAEICGVYPSTVINWVKRNQLPAYTTPGGHRRILESDLQAFLEKYKFPMPEWLPLGKRRVLVVEDDPAVGQLLLKAFKRAAPELEVRWLKDGVEALLALGQEPPDLVVLDVVMPNVDGGHVLATIRSSANTARTRVIGITGKRLAPEKLEYMEKNTDAFFLKPFDVKALCDKGLSLLRRQGVGSRGAKA